MKVIGYLERVNPEYVEVLVLDGNEGLLHSSLPLPTMAREDGMPSMKDVKKPKASVIDQGSNLMYGMHTAYEMIETERYLKKNAASFLWPVSR